MRRLFVVLIVGLVAVPSVAVAVPDARLAVSGLTVTPDAPTVGEPVTVTATVRNSAGSNSAVELTEVRLVAGETTLATAADPGSLSPGDTLSVDLTHQFASSGVQQLTVVAVGEDADGEQVTVRRPVTVVVERTAPTITVDAKTPVAGSETSLEIGVANPNTKTYRDLVVLVDTPDIEPKRRVIPALAAGAQTTLNVSYIPAEPGNASVDVTVRYTTATGVERATERTTSISVAPLREDVGVALEPAADQQQQVDVDGGLGSIVGSGNTLQQQEGDSSGSPDALAVTVTNFGNAPIKEAVVVPRTADRRLPRVAVGELAPGESRTVEVSLASVAAPTTVTAEVTYRTGGQRGTATGRFDYRPPTGEIRLTGVDVSMTDGTVTLTGNAGNVGAGKVTGVIVRVLPAEGVEPAYPRRDYFIGSVEGSALAPFELTATVDPANATAIPVEVRYRVNGKQVTRTVEFPLEGIETSDEESDSGSPAIAGLASLGVVLLAGGAIAAARRRR